jgi:4-aminobutyrate aminotransferase-like enzyme
VLRFQPPLVISKQQIDRAIDILGQALRETVSL